MMSHHPSHLNVCIFPSHNLNDLVQPEKLCNVTAVRFFERVYKQNKIYHLFRLEASCWALMTLSLTWSTTLAMTLTSPVSPYFQEVTGSQQESSQSLGSPGDCAVCPGKSGALSERRERLDVNGNNDPADCWFSSLKS